MLSSERLWSLFLMLPVLSGLSVAGEAELEHAARKQAPEQTIKTNMFDLQFEKLFHLEVSKWGGGIGHTEKELLILTGEGQLRAVNLQTEALTVPAIKLPKLNEELALQHVKQSVPVKQQGSANSDIASRLRYDDVLVFESGSKRRIAISYSHFDPDQNCFSHRVSLLESSRTGSLAATHALRSDWDTIFVSQPCMPLKSIRSAFAGHQSGGRLELIDAEEGVIALTLGDYGHDGSLVPNFPQDPDADYGKIWRIDIDSRAQAVISIGHRNPQGITTTSDGAIWSVEHGPFGGDELNLVHEGENYGWPHVFHGLNYGRKPWRLNKAQGRHEGFVYPVFSWVPSIAPSNIDQIDGFHPFWDGDLVVFTMKTKAIHRLRIHEERVVFDEAIKFHQRIRYGTSHSATASIYLWTDSGDLFRVRPADTAWPIVAESQALYELFKDGGPADYIDQHSHVLEQCLECHSGLPGSPPELKGIIGKDIASAGYSDYSDALVSRPGVWNVENLRAFLKNPPAFAPGTSMPSPVFSSDEDIDQLLRELALLR